MSGYPFAKTGPLKTPVLRDEQIAVALQCQRDRWGANAQCPMCGHAEWIIGRKVVFLESPPTGLLTPATKYAALQVACANCGNTLLVNASIAGVLPEGHRP